MEEKVIKKKAFLGVIWKITERVCAQAVSFIVSIILARILMPKEKGSFFCSSDAP